MTNIRLRQIHTCTSSAWPSPTHQREPVPHTDDDVPLRLRHLDSSLVYLALKACRQLPALQAKTFKRSYMRRKSSWTR